jgi:hypothetical protein
MKRTGLALALGLGILMGGCDSRVTGPVTLTGTLQWEDGAPPPGGALLFLSSPGIEQIQGEGGTLSWDHTPPGEEGGVRVLLIHTGNTEPLRFSVRLSDAALPNPSATVLELTGRDNERIPLSPGYRVRFDR